MVRKMQVPGATDLASKFQNDSDSSNLKPKEEIEHSIQWDNVRCPCGISLSTESMIKVITFILYWSSMDLFIYFCPFKVSAYS